MNKPIQHANFAVLDTETSGDNPEKHGPVEIGLVLTNISASLVAAETLVNPGHPITNGAKAIHHLLDEDVQGAPDLRTALKTVIAPAVAGHVLDAYVAHFAKFDASMLPMLNKTPWLCTYRLAKKLFPELPHHSNQFLRYELGLEVPEVKGLPAHRAMADALVTAALLRRLLAEVVSRADAGWPQDVEGLVALVSQPFINPICGFPKHAGKPWTEVVKKDSQYMVWLLQPKDGQKPLDEDTRFSIEHFLTEAGVKP